MDLAGTEQSVGDALPAGAGGVRARVPLLDLLLAARRAGGEQAPAGPRAAAGPPGAAGPPPEGAPSGTPALVLVVARRARLRAALRARLEAGGFETAEAADGASAVALARSARPAVAVVDLRPPDAGGLDIARQLRREQPATRVVLHASVVSPTAITAARQAGAFALVLEHAAEGCLVEFVRAAMPDHPASHHTSVGHAMGHAEPG